MCLFPINATLPSDWGRPTLDPEGSLKLPCGQCYQCISKRALEWATRAKHEISLHKENSFITLTYNPENLNSDFIIKSDFQKFVKRLRKKLYSSKKLRYMVSYEYGTKLYRPHMHVIFFGYNPSNQKFLKNTPSGNPIFTSQEISDLWDKGFHSIGTANEKTAYYIASYALKGKKKTIHHPDTGETIEIADTMDASKRPAIGLDYFLKNYQQLIDTKITLPRYYKKKLEENFPQLYEEYQNSMVETPIASSSGEKYAKYIIDSQKLNLSSTHHRTDGKTAEEIKKGEYYERLLKSNRDDYIAYTQRK